MTGPVRLGLIGAGRWGRNYIRTVAALPQARLARLASRNPGSASLVPTDCTVTGDWRELLDPATLDGLIVATPPQRHAEMALAAIAAGLPVLVEKPLSMDVGEARSLGAAAAARDALAMVGHTHLFSPAWRALKALQPRLGAVRTIVAEAGNLGPYRADVPVLWDWGAHDVAMCLDLLGADPASVAAALLERRAVDGGSGETVSAELRFPGPVVAALRWSNLEPKRRRFTVTCERGSLVYDDLAAAKLVVSEAGDARVVEIEAGMPLALVVAEFAAAITARDRDAASLELGVRVVEILAQCEAAISG